MGITVTFDHLDELSVAELRAALAAFQDSRDRFAADGRVGIADIYATVLVALAEERDRRRREWRNVQEKLTPNGIESEPATWEGDEHVG